MRDLTARLWPNMAKWLYGRVVAHVRKRADTMVDGFVWREPGSAANLSG
jgi:hypothetical protein